MKSECDEMNGKTIEELSNKNHEYADLAYAMSRLEQRQNSPGIVEDIIDATGVYPHSFGILRFYGGELEKTCRLDRNSKRYELAYYLSGQGEAPILYIDWVTVSVHDIYNGIERPH